MKIISGTVLNVDTGAIHRATETLTVQTAAVNDLWLSAIKLLKFTPNAEQRKIWMQHPYNFVAMALTENIAIAGIALSLEKKLELAELDLSTYRYNCSITKIENVKFGGKKWVTAKGTKEAIIEKYTTRTENEAEEIKLKALTAYMAAANNLNKMYPRFQLSNSASATSGLAINTQGEMKLKPSAVNNFIKKN